jgi:hypothetical protein
MLVLSTLTVKAGKPSWVKQRPSDPSCFIGIGVTAKTDTGFYYINQARSLALKEMASEIKVTVSSNSVLHQFENNYAVKEAYESKVQTTVMQTLEGYEVETWAGKDEYWVMVKLKKERYLMNHRLALDKALKTAQMYYMSGKKQAEENDAIGAISNYGKAAEAIAPYPAADLTIKSVDGDINIGISLYQAIREVMGNIEIVPAKHTYQIQFSKQMQLPMVVTAMYQTTEYGSIPLTGLPLAFEFSRGTGMLTPKAVTNRDGEASCSVTRFETNRRLQEIKAMLDLGGLVGETAAANPVVKAFFPPELLPKTMMSVELIKPLAYIEMQETVFGQPSGTMLFDNQIKALLSENFFVFTPNRNEAEVIVNLSSEFAAGDEKKGQGYSIFIVYGDFHISITDAVNNAEYFSDSASSIKGMTPGDYEHALKNCREKLSKHFEKQVLPKMEQIDM